MYNKNYMKEYTKTGIEWRVSTLTTCVIITTWVSKTVSKKIIECMMSKKDEARSPLLLLYFIHDSSVP